MREEEAFLTGDSMLLRDSSPNGGGRHWCSSPSRASWATPRRPGWAAQDVCLVQRHPLARCLPVEAGAVRRSSIRRVPLTRLLANPEYGISHMQRARRASQPMGGGRHVEP
jgi:hypothetical protein